MPRQNQRQRHGAQAPRARKSRKRLELFDGNLPIATRLAFLRAAADLVVTAHVVILAPVGTVVLALRAIRRRRKDHDGRRRGWRNERGEEDVPMLQSGAGAAHFFRKVRGNPVPSSALMEPMTRRFVASLRGFAHDGGVDLVRFERHECKDDRTKAYLAGFEGAEGVLYVGVAQETRQPDQNVNKHPVRATRG